MADGGGGGTMGGLPGGGGYGGGGGGGLVSVNPQTGQVSINQGGLVSGAFKSRTPLPTDDVWIGAAALGRPTGTRGHDPHRYSGFTTYGEAQSLPGNWYAEDPGRYKALYAKMVMNKMINADAGLPEVMSKWDDLLQMAVTLNKSSGGKQNWTPWQVLDSYNRSPGSLGTRRSGDWLIDNATGDRVKYVGPKTKTTKQTAIDLSNPEEVQAIATQVLSQMIGRAPTDGELAQFKASLNGYERGHPEITTTTDHYDDQGQVTASDVVHAGGVDEAARQVVLQKGVKKTKEYGKYQAGTTYFNALLQMVGGQ